MNRKHRHYSNKEKQELLDHIESSGGPIREALARLGISKSTYYDWKNAAEIRKGLRAPTENSPRNFYLVSQALKHQKTINRILVLAPCTAQAPLSERLAVIDTLHSNHHFPIHSLCEALDVDRGTYYNYAKRGKVRTGQIWYMQRKVELVEAVERIFNDSKQRFGAQKIVDTLKTEGIATTRKYVLKIMRERGLHCIRQSAKATYERLSAERINIVARKFSVAKPNNVWVGDVTYFRVKERMFYICAILDLYSRRIIAYRISTSNSTRLTKSTMSDALAIRQPTTGLVFHSDQGTNYTARAYRELLAKHGIVQSFSASGRPQDNAVIESFFRNLKTEELYRHDYRSFNEFKAGVKEYVSFYNEKRPHRANNGMTPCAKDRI